jgi:hypothetical protein
MPIPRGLPSSHTKHDSVVLVLISFLTFNCVFWTHYSAKRATRRATSNGKNHLQADQLREDGFRSLMCDVTFIVLGLIRIWSGRHVMIGGVTPVISVRRKPV